jgi:hypothetical protein
MGFMAGELPMSGTGSEAVSIQVPLASLEPESRCLTKVEIRLTARQARTLQRAFLALHSDGQMMANGHHVDRPTHVVAWLLDEIARHSPSERNS